MRRSSDLVTIVRDLKCKNQPAINYITVDPIKIYLTRRTYSYMNSAHGKVKVRCTLVLRLCTGRTANRGSRGIALPFHDHGTRRW